MLSSIASQLGGSGIDTGALIRDLAAASRAPKAAVLEARERASQAKISSIGRIKAGIAEFASSLSQIATDGILRTQPRSSDETILTASLSNGGAIGSLASTISVQQLAKSQSVYSEPVASPQDPIGRGTFTLTVGTRTASITIDETNDSLAGLAAAISASGLGVEARVYADQGQSRLSLRGPTGNANAFTLAVDAGGDASLGRFAYGGTGGMTLAQSATDALFTVDGIPFARSSNTVSDALEGVALTLKKASPDTLVTIAPERPTEALKTTAANFMTAFNAIAAELRDAQQALGSDQSLRMVRQQLAGLVAQSVTSSTAFNSLADIGVSTNRDGTISLDTAKLNAALAADPDAVEAIFAAPAASVTSPANPGLAGALNAIAQRLNGSGGAISSLSARAAKEADSLAKQRIAFEAREDRFEAQLEQKFSGLDARLGTFRALQSYLDQQVKLWTRSG